MHVAAADPTTPAPTPAPTSGSNQLNPDDFITLLVAQLKNQDPTNPLDPTQFVGQLVQFNSLEQLIDINQELTPAPPAPPTSSNSSTNPAAAAAPAQV